MTRTTRRMIIEETIHDKAVRVREDIEAPSTL
jgi:hypothetical protein